MNDNKKLLKVVEGKKRLFKTIIASLWIQDDYFTDTFYYLSTEDNPSPTGERTLQQSYEFMEALRSIEDDRFRDFGAFILQDIAFRDLVVKGFDYEKAYQISDGCCGFPKQSLIAMVQALVDTFFDRKDEELESSEEQLLRTSVCQLIAFLNSDVEIGTLKDDLEHTNFLSPDNVVKCVDEYLKGYFM